MSSSPSTLRVTGIGLICTAGIGRDGVGSGTSGKVSGFRARTWIDRKNLKLMTRAVQLGVAAVRMAIEDDGEVEQQAPHRRGLFVGASPQPGDPGELAPALAAARNEDGQFDLQFFAEKGYPLIHPLWLLRGLSNNVLGFASAAHDLQGPNASYCDGSRGGLNAISEAAHAVAEGRVDVAIAGGADCLLGADTLLDRPCGEGAAFLVIRRGPGPGWLLPPLRSLAQEDSSLGYLGAASLPVALARMLLGSDRAAEDAEILG